MLSRAKLAVDALDMALREGSEREDELLQLLVENLAPMYEEAASNGGGGGGGGGGGTARATSPTKTSTPQGPLAWVKHGGRHGATTRLGTAMMKYAIRLGTEVMKGAIRLGTDVMKDVTASRRPGRQQ